MWSWFRVFAVVTTFQLLARAFTFSNTDPTQCDDIIVRWQGGTPPFLLHLIPVFDAPRNISLPGSAFRNGKGSYSVQLPFKQGKEMLVAMSDAQGFGTGGVSNVFTVGASRSGAACDIKGPGVAFTYQLNSALQQCRPYTISGYDQAVQPVTIYGIIPHGQSFALHPPNGPTSFDWDTNVASGTNIVFFVVDAQGRQGGTSDVTRVGISDDTTCLNNNSPSSTKDSATSTSTATSTTTASSPTGSGSSSGGIGVGAIAGTVIGAVLFLAMVITLSLYFFRRKRDKPYTYPPFTSNRQSRSQYRDDVLGAAPEPHPYAASTVATDFHPYTASTVATDFHPQPPQPMNPFGTNPSQYQSLAYQPYSATNSVVDFDHTAPPLSNPHEALQSFHPPFVPGQAGTTSTRTSYVTDTSTPSTSSKARMAGATTLQPPPRFILHTDVEDTVPLPDENGVVELPPMYSERRAPLTVANPSSDLPYARPPSMPPHSNS